MKAKALLCALLVLGLAAPVASAGSVKVRSVSAPRTATAGTAVNVTVKLAGRARRRAARLTFYLSSDARRDRRDVRLKTDAGRPRIAANQAPGPYRLIACAGKSCRASRAFEVTRTPVGTRELVDRAVAAGKLSPEQGLVYRAFAAFGDRRLPSAYAGDNTAHEDTIMREVAASWAKLSASQRRQVEPFFTPPAAKGSWASGSAAASAGASAAAEPACGTSRFAARGWRSIARKDGHVRIWWQAVNDARFAKRARSLLGEAEDAIWRRLWDVFGRDALGDGDERCFHGPDGKLDIYLTTAGAAYGKASTINYPDACSAVPSFIVFNAGYSPPTRWELAHELTHAFQYAFPVGNCSNWDNFDEAVATWGGQYIYPRDDQEHQFPWFIKEPGERLADASYEGWVFPYALEQLVGPGVMQRIYEQGASHEPMDAIDAGVPGGLAKVYPDFATLAWNQHPVKPSFWEWDGFDPVPEDEHGSEIVAEQVDPGPAGQTVVDVPIGLKPLARAYRRFKLGPGITQITIEKPSYADLSVQAMVHTPGGGWKKEDWGAKQPVWCPVDAADRPDEIILALANTSTSKETSGKVPLRMIATNIGCNKYVGEASGTIEYGTPQASTHTVETFTVTGIVYKRTPYAGTPVPRFIYDLTAAKATWSMSGTMSGCTVKAGPVTVDVTWGQLDIRSSSSPSDIWGRRYHAGLSGFNAVQGTATCPNGTDTRYFGPRAPLLTTSGLLDPQKVAPSGALEGTASPWVGSDITANYKWKLVPAE